MQLVTTVSGCIVFYYPNLRLFDPMTLSRLLSATVFGAASLLTALSAQAHTVTTDPVSAFTFSFLGMSDSHVSIPLHRAPVFDSRIESIDLATNTITFANSPGWATNALVAPESHYLLVKSGVDEGMWLTITANTADSITVQTAESCTLGNLVIGELAAIVPHWTPRSMFHINTPPMIDLYLYRSPQHDVNLTPTVGIYHNGIGWYDVFYGTGYMNDYTIFPTESLLVRSFEDPTLEHTLVGAVPMSVSRTIVRNHTVNKDEDLRLAYRSPVEVRLVFSDVPVQQFDTIWMIDNDLRMYNKSASRIYEYFNGVWYDAMRGMPATESILIKPGDGLVYRKAGTPTPDIQVWKQQHPHLD